MKKLIITILVIMLMASTAWASPFLISGCQDYVDQYVLVFDGGTPITVDAVVAECTGVQSRLSFDLAPLALVDGTHQVIGTAKNMWEESASTPFDFSKAVPVNLTGIGLSATP